jgi:ligand-binding sensor domain-containing protein
MQQLTQLRHRWSTVYSCSLRLLMVIASLVACQQSNGQFSSLRFRNINSQNGLSHNTVTCIGQDTLGFMWFGTFNGVNRFDGHDFKHYEADAKNKTGLTISRAINIYTDTSGSLWVRTIDSTLHKYNYDTDDFTRYGNKEVPTEVHQAMQRQQGEETYAYKNHHFRFQREKVRWFTYTDSSSGHTTNDVINHNDPYGIQDSYIISIFIDRDHNLWVGTFNNGIYIADLDRKPFHHFYFKSGSGLEQANIVRAIYQDHLHLYLGTRDYGLLKLDKQGRVLAHYQHDPKNNESLASNDVRKIYRDSKQRLWIAARGGISILNEKTEASKQY